MSPTSYGEILVRHARSALSQLGLARKEIAALKSGLAGKATIGVVFDPQTHLLPMAITRLKQRHPGVLVCIETDPCRQLIQKLRHGDLDMVVGSVLDSARADDLVYESLGGNECYAVVASARHPLADQKALQLSNLIEQPWILPPTGSVIRDKLSALFVQNGLAPPANIVEAVSLPVITSLLQQSNMVAALPEAAMQTCRDAGDLKVLMSNLPLQAGAFGLITRRDPQLSPGAHLLLKTLRELGGQLHPVDAPSTVDAPTSSHAARSRVRELRA
jgi:DNA-binding transcriptional LysR family regulator